MKVALLSLALSASQLGSPSLMHVADRVPHLNVEALCKETTDVDKAMQLSEAQSFSKCMQDEMAAQQQIAAVWATTPAKVRDRCETEATIGGVASYVDLLSCMQMDNPTTGSSVAPLRGASKTRNTK